LANRLRPYLLTGAEQAKLNEREQSGSRAWEVVRVNPLGELTAVSQITAGFLEGGT